MKRKFKSIQFNLFSTYSLIIILLAVIFVSFFYLYVSNLLRENTFASLDDLSRSITQKLDLEIQKLDDLSMNVLYSNLIKEQFSDYISFYSNSKDSKLSNEAEHYYNLKNLNNVMVAIIGPSQTVQQVNLYDFKGNMIGAGVYNKENKIDVKEKPWYTHTVSKNGKKYILPPHKEALLGNVINYYKNKYYISLYRVFFDQFNMQQGIVEVIQDCDTIFAGINEPLIEESTGRQIYIYNQQGELVYPYQELSSQNYQYYYRVSHNKPEKLKYLNKENPESKKNELISYNDSDFTGWRIIVVAQENKLLAPLFFFTKVTFYGTLLVLLMALGFSYFASKRLTIPIAKMHKTINSMNLNMVSSEDHPELNSGLNELEELNMAFQEMNRNLKKSMNKLLESQTHEMQARMLALQSQMNPHFLYNSIANISIMAEENMNKQIIIMCENFSYMLRYISSSDSSLVNLEDELEYTSKYLSIMKIRYGDSLKYEINLDEKLLGIRIPKLIIQPLVENSIKYGTRNYKNKNSWQIRLSGEINEDKWQIVVEDDGAGFTRSVIKNFWDKVEEFDKIERTPDLKLEGMGLLNIYIRLKLTYGSNMIFRINDKTNGGAVVIIGGLITCSKLNI